MAIGVSGILSLIAGSLLLNGSYVVAEAAQRAGMADTAARGLELVLRYVREIEQDAGLTGKAQVSTASATELRFGNYGFRRNGTELQMTIDNATTWRRAATNVSNLTFRYYNLAGGELTSLPLSATDREAIRQVSVEIKITVNGNSHRVRGHVYLRSFMSEAT